MKDLAQRPTTGIPGIWFPFRRPSVGWLAERCSAARVCFAAANNAAPLPPARHSTQSMIATGGSIREPDAARFLRLTKDENQMEVDKTS
jgi:hypothetical protein